MIFIVNAFQFANVQISFAFEFFIFDLKVQLFLLQRRLPQPQDFIGFVPIADRPGEGIEAVSLFFGTMLDDTHVLLESPVVFMPSLLLSS